MAKLFEPCQIRGVKMSNRVMVSPMCQYSADAGCPTAWHLAHLGAIAISGPGLLCLEATAVCPEGRITAGCLGLWDDATESALRQLVVSLREIRDVPLCLQLSHAGRKASRALPWEGGQQLSVSEGGWVALAPSPVPHAKGDLSPRELAPHEVAAVVGQFARAASRARRIGFDAVEIHAAHGYLLHEFLSPVSNRRRDAYGGERENRARIVLEVVRAVRAAISADMALGVRISATDGLAPGRGCDLNDSLELARQLAHAGADWIDVSSGGVAPEQVIPVSPGYQVPFADAIRRATGITTVAVGMITSPSQAEEVLVRESADIVALGRAILADPRWIWRAAEELDARIPGPPQYWRAMPRGKNKIFSPLETAPLQVPRGKG